MRKTRIRSRESGLKPVSDTVFCQEGIVANECRCLYSPLAAYTARSGLAQTSRRQMSHVLGARLTAVSDTGVPRENVDRARYARLM